MGTSDDKDMLMRKLAIYEFGCRNILYLMFESLSIYCLYQKRLVETMCYSEIVKPNILLRKLKQRKIPSSLFILLGNKGTESGRKYST